MASLHLFAQDNWNEMHHDFSGYVMPLMLALTSCDADGIINDMIAFVSKIIKIKNDMQHDISG